MAMIRRVAYTRHMRPKMVRVAATPQRRAYSYQRRASTSRVASAMIRNLGRPGRGPKTLPTPKAGMLTMWGYSTAASPSSRHRALKNAITRGHQSPVSVLRRLQLIEQLTKQSQKTASHMYHADRMWLRSSVGGGA